MRSSVRFVMHPDDELEFESIIRRDASVKFVDGPRWPTKNPPVRKSLKDLSDDYCILWSPNDIARLNAKFMNKCNDWYCRSEQLAIQFLRSEIDDSIVTEGRIAFASRVKVGRDRGAVQQVAEVHSNDLQEFHRPMVQLECSLRACRSKALRESE